MKRNLVEADLVKMRTALEKPTLPEAIKAMEQVLADLGYEQVRRVRK